MVAAPEVTRRQAQGKPQKRLIQRLLGITLLIGLLAMLAVCMLAPVFSDILYRQAELLVLLRRCCPLIPVMALCQVISALMNGLGMQGSSLRIAIGTNLLSVLLTYLLASLPGLRLWGAIIAMATGQMLTLLLSLRALLRAAA